MCDLKAPVVGRLLTLHGVMTIEAVHARGRVTAPLELVHDGRRLVPVALGALSGRLHELRGGLTRLHGGALALDDPGGGDGGGPQEHRDEDRSEHGRRLPLAVVPKDVVYTSFLVAVRPTARLNRPWSCLASQLGRFGPPSAAGPTAPSERRIEHVVRLRIT